MAQLTVLLATFTVLLFLVDASIYRTTVIIDEENPQERCDQQFQQQQKLMYCQEFVKKQLEETGPRMRQDRKCCQQLERTDSRCRCENLEKAIQQQQSEGELESQEVRKAFQIARDIPERCNLEPRQCQFGSPYVY